MSSRGGDRMISAIILAADVKCDTTATGSAYGRCSILEEVANNFLLSRAGEVVLVLSARDTKIEKKLAGKPVKFVVKPESERGKGFAIKAGLEAADSKADAFLIALGDQPLIKGKVIDALISRYEAGGKGIVCPVYKGIRGHPILFSASYKKDLMSLSGRLGGREIIQQHKDDVAEVEVDEPGVLFDIQADADYLMQMRKISTLDKA